MSKPRLLFRSEEVDCGGSAHLSWRSSEGFSDPEGAKK